MLGIFFVFFSLLKDQSWYHFHSSFFIKLQCLWRNRRWYSCRHVQDGVGKQMVFLELWKWISYWLDVQPSWVFKGRAEESDSRIEVENTRFIRKITNVYENCMNWTRTEDFWIIQEFLEILLANSLERSSSKTLRILEILKIV